MSNISSPSTPRYNGEEFQSPQSSISQDMLYSGTFQSDDSGYLSDLELRRAEVQWVYERRERGFPNPIHASPMLYVPPPPQNTPPLAQAIVPVRRQLFPDPIPDFFSSPQSPNMLVPHASRLYQLSPRALSYSLTQHVLPQEPAELNIGGESETTQCSNNNEVSNEMEWVDDGNDEELIRHMNTYEMEWVDDGDDEELIRHMNTYEKGWTDDGNDEELHRHMGIYECCTPVLR